MKCLLMLTLAVACLNDITSLALHSDDHLKLKLEETRNNKEVKEAVKTVVKLDAEVTDATTPGVSSSIIPSTTQTPAQAEGVKSHVIRVRIRDKQDASQQRLESDLQAIREKATGPRQPKSDTLTPQQLADLVGNNKETKGPDYTNVFAVLSGGGLVSAAKAIQTLFVNMKSKKKKKGKKRDSESNSDSEEEGPTHTVAVKIEMSNALQTQNTPSKTAVPEIKAVAIS